MKKILALSFVLALGLGIAFQASASDVSNGRPPALGSTGGTLIGGNLIQIGQYPGAQGGWDYPLTAAVNITAGDALVLVAGKSVSETTTVGDTNFIGFAKETVSYGGTVQVVHSGIIRANVGMSVTAGDRLVMSATAGKLTPTSAVTASNYTAVSGSPLVARAMVTYTYVTYSPSVLVVIGR